LTAPARPKCAGSRIKKDGAVAGAVLIANPSYRLGDKLNLHGSHSLPKFAFDNSAYL
jgi:hypothetical protein